MSPGGKGFEDKRERRERKKSLKKNEKRRKAMEEESKELDFDPGMFLSSNGGGFNKFKV